MYFSPVLSSSKYAVLLTLNIRSRRTTPSFDQKLPVRTQRKNIPHLIMDEILTAPVPNQTTWNIKIAIQGYPDLNKKLVF